MRHLFQARRYDMGDVNGYRTGISRVFLFRIPPPSKKRKNMNIFSLQKRTEWGELMLSLSYLPTAERLTVVVVKARNLVFPRHRDSGDPFVKVRE